MNPGQLVNIFVVLFVVIDPVGPASSFAVLTRGLTVQQRRGVALRGVLIAAFILVVFGLIGRTLLQLLGIGMPAFRLAGGILLFMLAIDMVLARQSGLRGATPAERSEAIRRDDISVFPLGIPLLALAVFVTLWANVAARIDTSLGGIPGPAAVWQEARNLVADHKAERARRADHTVRAARLHRCDERAGAAGDAAGDAPMDVLVANLIAPPVDASDATFVDVVANLVPPPPPERSD